jgi:glycosyltransferase involved in cell wall biosynthesis
MTMVRSPAPPKRILALAYACEPTKGSEPAAGWTWARILAHLFEVSVITRANNRDAIETALGGIPESARLHFIYVDLPYWARIWKRGQRGVRVYYLLWQLSALRAARRLNDQRPFDLVWHLTLANAWLGSVGPLIGPRFVYGPVGGGGRAPWRLVPTLGIRGAAYELVRTAAQLGGRMVNPLARLAWRKADLILVQNKEARDWFPARYRRKCRQFPHAVLEEVSGASSGDRHHLRTAIFVGRLLPWKGLALGLRAIALAPEWRLLVCGSGPDKQRLVRLVRRKGLGNRVTFLGWQPRSEVSRLMRDEAELLLFPSLHDDSPFTVVEAMAAGLPVLCLDRVGPPALAGPAALAVNASKSPRTVVTALARALQTKHFPPSTTIRERAESFRLSDRATLLSSELERSGVMVDGDMS